MTLHAPPIRSVVRARRTASEAAIRLAGMVLEFVEMKQSITAFTQDPDGHWRATLACGHQQHVRHDPPLISRPWVLTPEGRAGMIGKELDCKRCEDEKP